MVTEELCNETRQMFFLCRERGKYLSEYRRESKLVH